MKTMLKGGEAVGRQGHFRLSTAHDEEIPF